MKKLVMAREGHRVRHPDGRLLDPAGETVAWSLHWQLYARDGAIDVADVTETPTGAPSVDDAETGKKGK